MTKKEFVPTAEQLASVDRTSNNPRVRERRRKLFGMWVEISEKGYTDAYLAGLFGVSERTIQRDRSALGMLWD
jgi:hypothetical protein